MSPTPLRIITALQVAKKELSTILLEPSRHIGGVTTGGLSNTNCGNKEVIGGLSRGFYRRCGRYYGCEAEWRFEPHVATNVLQQMLDESKLIGSGLLVLFSYRLWFHSYGTGIYDP